MRGAKAYRGRQDGELVALVAERDPGALEALYDRYGTVAYSLACRVLTEGSLAEDVVREVFLSLWRDAGRFDPERGTVATYLLSMTHRRAVEVVRREENLRRRRPEEALGPPGAPGPATTPGPPGVPGRGGRSRQQVEEGLEAAGRGAQIRAALAELPEQQRQALLLACFGGYTQREVASLLGVPFGTVKAGMATGMRKLRDALRDASHQERSPWSRR